MATAPAAGYTLDDGLGTRILSEHRVFGSVEVLTVASELSAHQESERQLRAAAARAGASRLPVLAPVHAVECLNGVLRIVADAPAGIRLSDLLLESELGSEELSEPATLEIAVTVVRALADLHDLPGALAHGAVTPAHIVLTREGGCLLTDGIFGRALEGLQRNRESLWREFGLALPPSASVHRFDQRADVTQLGAVVLALLLQRPLRDDEYPRGMGDLVIVATPAERGPAADALRTWLQQALQLQPRAAFNSAVAAAQAFAEVLAVSGVRRTRRQARPFPMFARLDTMAAERCGM